MVSLKYWILHGLRFPDVVNDDPALIADSFVLPDEALVQLAPAEPYRSDPPSRREDVAPLLPVL